MNLDVLARVSVAFVALSLGAACEKGAGATPSGAAGAATIALPAGARRIDVNASGEGYAPAKIDVKKGETVVLRFTRTTKSDCLSQVVIPKLEVKKDLPLNEPVDILVKADQEGDIGFQCGMNMVKGNIHVSGS